VTDHAALTYLDQAKSHNPKLARWALRLSNYDYALKYKPGKLHGNADGLSRSLALPTITTPPVLPTCVETVLVDQHNPEALVGALEAMASDCHIDGWWVEATLVDP
jgi:hypothetical protein